jgi:hypothetical protein
MSCIPPKLQEVIISKFGVDSRVVKIISKFEMDKLVNMLSYVSFHDSHRKLNWKEVFPEIVKYFDINKTL